ncbi:sugar phosphate permease [Paraburkholderia tropica]|uniref:MFS transporter n=1 Tax=Paraburkholderia tropica TaxID=92647 RepID=UPI0018153B78|nr:MFS transporter [Paraburkholderia tropica]MBB3000766.1 sugar phosphate permease [Paraburkholderia tropica]MBB6320396.1 sugar phosphate permease [Paraburkholderia tropica]
MKSTSSYALPHAGRADMSVAAPDVQEQAQLCERAVRKASIRLLPVLLLGYIFSYLDRINVGFAALTMNHDLGLTSAQFGWGAGLFFVSYALCEVPSNLALHRFGARLWLSRIMVTWGVLSAAMAFAVGPHSFYALRLILGVAEAGFFPGVAFYLTSWFPRAYRVRVLAWFTLGIPLASVIGGPLSGALLSIHAFMGLSGWQWLFIAQGLPAAVLGIWAWAVLSNSPKDATWLSHEERGALVNQLESEVTASSTQSFCSAVADPRVLLLTLALFTLSTGIAGIGMWLPQIINREGLGLFRTGMLSTIPYACAGLAMVVAARWMDKGRDYAASLTMSSAVAALGFVVSAVSDSVGVALVGITIAMIGVNIARTALWAIPPTFLSGAAAAGCIAVINAVANCAGFAGPAMVGVVKEMTGSFTAGLMTLAVALAVTAGLAIVLGRIRR